MIFEKCNISHCSKEQLIYRFFKISKIVSIFQTYRYFYHNYIVWSKMIRNCHHICEEKLQENRGQRHFVAQSVLDNHWKFQPNSSNGTPVRSNCAKAVAQTPTQLAANRLPAAGMATLMSNECWSILEVSIRFGMSNVSIIINNEFLTDYR